MLLSSCAKHICFTGQVAHEARLVCVRGACVTKTLIFCMQSDRGCGQLAARADKIDAQLGC